jgi:uncharacterized protein YchJ
VEFCARFVDEDGKPKTHRENSRFVRIKGRWYYVDALSLDYQSAGIAP